MDRNYCIAIIAFSLFHFLRASTYMQGSVWSGFAIDGRRYRLVVRVTEQLCPYSDTDETSRERKKIMKMSFFKNKSNQIPYR